MGVGCYRGDRPHRDVRDDLLWRLTMISLIDTLRMEHSPLISVGITVAMAGWVGAGSLSAGSLRGRCRCECGHQGVR